MRRTETDELVSSKPKRAGGRKPKVGILAGASCGAVEEQLVDAQVVLSGRLLIHAGQATPRDGLEVGSWRTTRRPEVAAEGIAIPSKWLMYETQGEQVEWLPFGAIIGSCNLVDDVPIVPPLSEDELIPHALASDGKGGLTLFWEGDYFASSYDDQLPYGDFRPGRRAWLLEDAKPTTERCPWCWGESKFCEATVCCPGPWEGPCEAVPCPVCKGTGACDPIPAKGRQGLWNWTPTLC